MLATTFAEIHDPKQGQSRQTYAARDDPNAFHMNAALGPLAAEEIGVDTGADALFAQLMQGGANSFSALQGSVFKKCSIAEVVK